MVEILNPKAFNSTVFGSGLTNKQGMMPQEDLDDFLKIEDFGWDQDQLREKAKKPPNLPKSKPT